MRTFVVRIGFFIVLLTNPLAAAEVPTAPVAGNWIVPKSAIRATALAWLPDQSGIVAGDGSGSTRVWELATGRESAILPPAKQGATWIHGIAASNDGQRLAIANGTAGLRIWDRTTNRETTLLPGALFAGIPHEKQGVPSVIGVGFIGREIAAVSSRQSIARIAPDGKLLGKVSAMPIEFGTGEAAYIRDDAVVALAAGFGFAYYEGHEVDELRVWDFAKGRVLARSTLKDRTRPDSLAIAPDGRRAAVRDRQRMAEAPLLIFDVRSAQEIGSLALGRPKPGVRVSVEFSPDGRLLAVAVAEAPVTIYDTAKLTPLAQIAAGTVSALAFAPDGRRIAVAHSDGRVTLHDLRAALDPNPPKNLDTAACWNDLVSPDGTTAMRAVFRLADHPAEAVKLFEGRLAPITKPNAADLTKWMSALDAPAFADRQTAQKKLAAVAGAIVPELKTEAETNRTPEVVEAIQTLIETTDRTRRKLEGEALRAYRAVQVLEYCGAAAEPLLNRYAAGASGAMLTDEAAGANARRN